MRDKPPFRPWGEIEWVLNLSASRRWRFVGCLGTEERSVHALRHMHGSKIIEQAEMLRIKDPEPEDLVEEEELIDLRRSACLDSGCEFEQLTFKLDASLGSDRWRAFLDFAEGTSLCLDISSLPKRYFFQVVRAALQSPNVTDLLLTYTQAREYPPNALSGNPDPWKTIDRFRCDDPDLEEAAHARLIVGTGFAVEGLQEHLRGRAQVDVLIPFPAEPWSSVRRAWESAKAIEDSLEADPDQHPVGMAPSHHRVGALDTSTAFDTLLRLTGDGQFPATLAPLGPKPISVAMALLASQKPHFPVYYAQPKTYALNYSIGCGLIYAYWIKNGGDNLYAL